MYKIFVWTTNLINTFYNLEKLLQLNRPTWEIQLVAEFKLFTTKCVWRFCVWKMQINVFWKWTQCWKLTGQFANHDSFSRIKSSAQPLYFHNRADHDVNTSFLLLFYCFNVIYTYGMINVFIVNIMLKDKNWNHPKLHNFENFELSTFCILSVDVWNFDRLFSWIEMNIFAYWSNKLGYISKYKYFESLYKWIKYI